MAKRGNGEGSVYYQQSRERWVASLVVDGKRRVLYGKTRQEVARRLASALKDAEQGVPLPSAQLTVERFLAQWLEEVARPKLKASTYRSYEQLIRVHITPALGRHLLAKLTPQQVQSFLNDEAASGLSPRTVQYLHALLRSALG